MGRPCPGRISMDSQRHELRYTHLEYLNERMSCTYRQCPHFGSSEVSHGRNIPYQSHQRYTEQQTRIRTHLSSFLSCFVRTRFNTHNKSGLAPASPWFASPPRPSGLTSGVSNASTGEIVLNGVWLRKNIVQSSSCVSAPSGSIDMARTLHEIIASRRRFRIQNGVARTLHLCPGVAGTGISAVHPRRYQIRRAGRKNSGSRCYPWWLGQYTYRRTNQVRLMRRGHSATRITPLVELLISEHGNLKYQKNVHL